MGLDGKHQWLLYYIVRSAQCYSSEKRSSLRDILLPLLTARDVIIVKNPFCIASSSALVLWEFGRPMGLGV
ncbi:hypothetical protein VNO78_11122 [Psophocarpus tetragonolobus]|uniref:Uncharacterized protein n=1 Tax=Psophocarpus tetragonolobus TaxID=3891 RepID=A0AAN9XND3_PSOTE